MTLGLRQVDQEALVFDQKPHDCLLQCAMTGTMRSEKKGASMNIFRTLIAASAGLLASASLAQDLPRRGSLGVALGSSSDGLVVDSALSPSAEEVFKKGDVLLEIDGVATSSFLGLQTAIHKLPNGKAVSVKVRRGEEEMSFEVVTILAPLSKIKGANVDYGTATAPTGLRVRTVTAAPNESVLANTNGKPAVLLIQGITCRSIDAIGGEGNAYGALIRRLLKAGFVVGFADKPGIGDSDGEVCARGGFNSEMEGYIAAARALAARPDVDPSRLFGIGISMGGIQVPLVAQKVEMAGIVTWGTVVQPWGDYMITNFPMRTMIDKAASTKEDAQELIDLRRIMARALILEQSPARIEREDPETFARFTEEFGAIDGFGGRSLKFHQEVDKAPTPQAWEAFDGALLSMHGGYDWVATEADHRLAGSLVTKNGNGSAEFEIVPQVDHGWTAHDTLEESFRAPFAGRPDRRFHDRVTEWLTKQASG